MNTGFKAGLRILGLRVSIGLRALRFRVSCYVASVGFRVQALSFTTKQKALSGKAIYLRKIDYGEPKALFFCWRLVSLV